MATRITGSRGCGIERILVVTSKSGLEEGLNEALRGAGYRVDVALENDVVGPVALPPDLELALLVASDSPAETSQVCSAFKRDRPNLPIIVLGPDFLPLKLRLFALGADDYILDSFDQVELLVRIKSLVRRHRLSRL